MPEYIALPPEHELTQLHWFDLCEYGTRTDTLTNDMVTGVRRIVGLPSGSPCMVYFGNGRLAGLKSLNHNQQAIEELNAKGLSIYLFEPMCSYLEGTGHNQQFFSEYSYETDLSTILSDELESIKEYILRNNLINVTVHTCEYNVDFYFYRYSPYMKLKCDDLFLKSYTVYNTVSNEFKYDFQNRFVSFIWRWGTHRNLIAAYLALMTNNFTWYYDTSFDLLKDISWFDIEAIKKNDRDMYNKIFIGAEKLKKSSPYSIDIPKDAIVSQPITDATKSYWPKVKNFKQYETPAFENSYTDNLQQYYFTSFCDIVTETRFAQHCANFSEKLLQPIKYRRPFIVVGPPRTLEYLRSFGITTFSEYWNEDYDVCDNHHDRMIKIFKLIDRLNKIPMDTLTNMFHDMWMRKIFHNNYNAMLAMTHMKFPQLPPTNKSNVWKK